MADEYVLKKNVIDALISDKVEITDVHRAIGGERDFEVLNVTCDRHADMVMAIPAADVREVVTCAKCRYYSEKRKECGHINGLSELVFPTDYCSYGSVMREVDDG